MAFFNLTLRTRMTLLVDGEPSDYVSEHHGEITCVQEDTGDESVAGYVHAYKLHAGLVENEGKESLFDVCDCHSHEMHVLRTLLYEPEGYGFREVLIRRFEAFDNDLLVLDYVLIDPQWRGLRVGLLAARKMIDMLGGGCGIVVSEIAPLRRAAHEGLGVPAAWTPKTTTKEDRADAVSSLRGYYRQMGFTRLGRTPYYALGTALTSPSAEELLRPQTREE